MRFTESYLKGEGFETVWTLRMKKQGASFRQNLQAGLKNQSVKVWIVAQ